MDPTPTGRERWTDRHAQASPSRTSRRGPRLGATAWSQTPRPASAAAGLSPIQLLRGDFLAQSGSMTIYFASGSAQLTPQATTTLAAQAMWLRQHPEVAVRIEGHGDPTDTRDHALAMGAKRAAEARDYLILLGLPAAQISAMTLGQGTPGAAERGNVRSTFRRPGADTRCWLARSAPGAALRRSREQSSRARSRHGIPVPGLNPRVLRG